MKKDKLASLSSSKGASTLAPIPQSKYVGMNVMGESESANWAWNLLWHAGQTTYLKFKMLDTIRIENGNINSWLFTQASDGLIKSRSQQRWTLPSLLERTVDVNEIYPTPESVLKAHICTMVEHGASSHADDMLWKTISKKELSNVLIPQNHPTPIALVTFNRMEGPVSFAEISLEINARSKTAISEKPKVVTNVFYEGATLPVKEPGAEWMAPVADNHALPKKRLVCLNKQTCMTTEAYIMELRKALEDRGKCKIAKLVVVVLMENMDEGEKVLWLHHVKCAVLLNQSETLRGEGAACDDELENGTELYSRSRDNQQHGNQQDYHERRSNATSDLSTSTTTYLKRQRQSCAGDFCECPLDEEGVKQALLHADGNFRQELKRARLRHRVSEDSPSKDEEDNSAYKDSSRAEEHTGSVDNGLKRKVNRTVPMKAIALCRKEAETWELSGRSNHYDPLSMPWSRNMFEWWFGIGKNQAHARNTGATVPISSAHNIGKSLLGLKPINEEVEAAAAQADKANFGSLNDLKEGILDPETGAPMAKPKGSGESIGASAQASLGKNILYDLDENSYTGQTRRTVGQLSWYYAEAKVCQTCYQTYRDIDRRRDAIMQKQIKAMKQKQALTGEAQMQYDKEIEQRIFQQRKTASRLAAPPAREMERSKTSPDPVGARNRIVGAPKGVLPPLPWQLREEEKAAEYQNNKFSSSIVRNIRTKAQGMARAVQQDKLMERVEMKKQRQAMMKGGMLDEHSQLLTDESSQMQGYYNETHEKWQEYTGQSRMEVEMEYARQQAASRKVVGGLGENRPKPKSKDFDTKRLMHGWQRDAEELAKKIRAKNAAEAHTGFAAPVPDAAQRRKAAAQEAADVHNKRRLHGSPIEVKENVNNSNSHGNYRSPPKPTPGSPQRMGYGAYDDNYQSFNELGQGSVVSQLTMDQSMVNAGTGNYSNYQSSGLGQGSIHRQKAMEASQTSLEGLDDDEWIRAIMVKGKGGVNVGELLQEAGVGLDGGSVSSLASKKSALNRSGARTPKGSLRVSFGDGNAGAGVNRSPQRRANTNDDDGEEDDSDDDGAIGWSPFVIPSQ